MITTKFVIRTRGGENVREFAWELDFLPTLGSTINTYEAFDDPSDTNEDEAAYHFCDVTDVTWSLTDGRVVPTVILQPHDPHRNT